jgi:uncharacterized paraquat-inducible protein A
MKDMLLKFVRTNCFDCDRPIDVPETYKGRQPLCVVCRHKHTPALSQVVAQSVQRSYLRVIPGKSLSVSIGFQLKEKARQ